MTAAAVTAAGRVAAERLMVDACVIRRQPATVFNPGTGVNDVTPGEVAYEGKCRIRSGDTTDRDDDVGDSPVSTWMYIVSIPMGALHEGQPALIRADDLVTITASTLDPTLVDTVLRVRQVPQGTHLTARRLRCEAYGG